MRRSHRSTPTDETAGIPVEKAVAQLLCGGQHLCIPHGDRRRNGIVAIAISPFERLDEEMPAVARSVFAKPQLFEGCHHDRVRLNGGTKLGRGSYPRHMVITPFCSKNGRKLQSRAAAPLDGTFHQERWFSPRPNPAMTLAISCCWPV